MKQKINVRLIGIAILAVCILQPFSEAGAQRFKDSGADAWRSGSIR